MAQITSFGSLLKFATELERRSAAFYEAYAGESECGGLPEKLAQENGKRAATLERVRRENVTEMILEPIQDLEAEPLDILAQDGPDWMSEAITLEERVGSFYGEAAQKANRVLAEVRRIFERMAKANARRKAELETLRDSAQNGGGAGSSG